MSAATLQKPAARKRSRAPVTLAQATGTAMTDLAQAIDLISSARSAADTGHYLERTLRMAEEIALTVMGWLDHGKEDRDTWMDRLYDCQSLLMCAVAYNERPASTLLSQQAANLLDKITDDLGHQFSDATPRPVASVEVTSSAEDLGARRRLAFNAYYQQSDLISGLKELLEEASKHPGFKNGQMHVGIVSRIELLANIIFHAVRLDGDDGTGWARWDELSNLQRAFDGGLA